MPDLAGEPDHAERADRVSQVPFAGPRDDDHPPTLEVPAFAEPDEPPTASTAEFGGPSAADAPGAPSDENAELDAHAAAQEMTAEPAEPAEEETEEKTEEETAAFRYTPAPAIWPTGDTIAEDGAGTDVAPRTRPVPGWIERVADSGDPPMQRHDYWDTDDDGGLRGTSSVPNGPGVPVEQDTPLRASPFTTVPRLNRVRATPIPPEEDEEAPLP